MYRKPVRRETLTRGRRDASGQLRFTTENLIIRVHSFPRQNLTNSTANLVNSDAHRGKADEIRGYTVKFPRLD